MMEFEWPKDRKKGLKIESGDIINFSYGIPPVGVNALVFLKNGKLMLDTTGHIPSEITLIKFKKTITQFYVKKGNQK